MVDKFKSLSPTAKYVAAVMVVLFVSANAFATVFYFGPIWLTTHKPTQPIAFSHKLHAGTNKIACQYCHTMARRSEMAGIPSVKRCMNCHDFVKTEAPLIVKVTEHSENETPIIWEKVFNLPDHVWFSHKRHIKKDIACQKCHGPVETMDVLYRWNNFQMGFCLGCHQENGAPTDCWTCHT